ncbi:MAG: hypothetical protein KAR57_04555 [Bacteroidales bacterium]|nr:hypothetical protein [Bacteroidales bacterium]
MRTNFLHKTYFQKLIFAFTLILNAFLVIILFADLSSVNIGHYLSSDMLYLPSIYKDLFIDKSGLAGWNLNAAPNFLPDMFVFFIISSFFNSFIPACFTFSLLQILTFIVLLAVLYKNVFKQINYIHLSFASLLMGMFLMAYLVNHDFVYTFYMLSISYHIGAFIMSILSLILIFKFLKSEKNLHLILLFIISLFSVINDRLFVIMFSLPVFSLLFLLLIKKERKVLILKILASNLIVFLLGLFLFRMLRLSGYVHIISLSWKAFNFANIIPALKIFLEQHLFYLSKFDFRGIINMLFLISFITHIILLFKNLLKAIKGKDFNKNELVYLLIFTSSIFITLIAPVINGSYVSQAILRYNIYSFYAGIFSIGYLIYKIQSSYKFSLNYLIIILVILMITESAFIITRISNQNIKNELSDFMNYYPENVKCIDELSQENNLRYGVAEYWDAKQITMFSKQNVRVYTVLDNLGAWYHVTNQNWFYKDGKGKYANPKFNFVITDRLNKNKISNQLGIPTDTLKCADGTEIFIYPEFEFGVKTRKPTIKE